MMLSIVPFSYRRHPIENLGPNDALIAGEEAFFQRISALAAFHQAIEIRFLGVAVVGMGQLEPDFAGERNGDGHRPKQNQLPNISLQPDRQKQNRFIVGHAA